MTVFRAKGSRDKLGRVDVRDNVLGFFGREVDRGDPEAVL